MNKNYFKAYYLRHRKRFLTKQRQRYLEKKKEILKYVSQWQKKNKEAHNAACKKYRLRHKRRRQLSIRKWEQNHSGYIRIKNIKRHFKRGLRVPKFGQDGIVEIYKKCP